MKIYTLTIHAGKGLSTVWGVYPTRKEAAEVAEKVDRNHRDTTATIQQFWIDTARDHLPRKG